MRAGVGWHRHLCAAVLVLAGIAVYANSLKAPFVFDDYLAIVGNRSILDIRDIRAVLTPPREGNTVQARPVVNLTFAVNHAFSGMKPRGFRLINIAIHFLNGLLLFGIVHRTLQVQTGPMASTKDRQPFTNTSILPAFFVALLWLVHPLNTSAVTYIAQRAESLMAFFYLLTLYAFGRAVSSAPTERPSRRWAAVAVLACTVGMGCKEIMVTAPLVLLLFDRAFLAGTWRRVWDRHRGLHLALALTWLVFLAIEWRLGGSRDNFDTGYSGLEGSWRYLLTQAGVITHYLRLAFWPDRLCIDYYGWPLAGGVREVWPQLLLVGGLAGATLWACVRAPRLGFPGAWCFLILAPTSSLMPVADRAAEHRMYLPLMALVSLMVVGGWAAFMRRSRRSPGADDRTSPLALALALALIAVALGLRTAWRNWDYRSHLSIWLAAIETRPLNARALMNLGAYYGSVGYSTMSIRYLEQAIDVDPTYAPAVIRSNIAAARMRAGDFARARLDLEAALAMNPDDSSSWFNLGLCELYAGNTHAAVDALERALACDPTLAIAHARLGEIHRDAGELNLALDHFTKALNLRRDLHQTYADRAEVWMRLGNRERVQADVEACRRHGGPPPPHLTEWLRANRDG